MKHDYFCDWYGQPETEFWKLKRAKDFSFIDSEHMVTIGFFNYYRTDLNGNYYCFYQEDKKPWYIQSKERKNIKWIHIREYLYIFEIIEGEQFTSRLGYKSNLLAKFNPRPFEGREEYNLCFNRLLNMSIEEIFVELKLETL